MSQPAVFAYCERVEHGLWAEPLNASSNLVFFAAAALAAHEFWRSRGPTVGRRWDIAAAIALLAAVGLGSSLWHTLATPLAELADTIPILLLVSVLLGSSLRRLLGASAISIAAALVVLQVASVGVAARAPAVWNGSLGYAPAWSALVLLAAGAWTRSSPHTRALLVTGILFSVSLLLRTVDRALCPSWPWGTHFLWHILNALVLFRLLQTLLAASVQRASPPSA